MPTRIIGNTTYQVVEQENFIGVQFILVAEVMPWDFPTLGVPESPSVFVKVDEVLYRWDGSHWVHFFPEKGDKGDKGDIGPIGPQGEQGNPGLDARRIDTYSGTTDSNGLFTVTYGTAFAAIPNVHVQPPTGNNQQWQMVSSTVDGFSFRLVQRESVNLLSTDLLLASVTNVANQTCRATVVAV